MSFQGDVAGIGLGELLQGLSRGGRDGVLTLYGERLSSAIGLRKGQLYILAGPDEEESEWRERAQRAWAENPQPGLESSRRNLIARAARLETVYQLLEASNLHFRFEPGPLPSPTNFAHRTSAGAALAGEESGPHGTETPWGPGMTVEYMLLEHARIADESSSGPAAHLASHDMPRALDASRLGVEARDFLTQCDGSSTAQEIADRLGWTLSQCRQKIGAHLAAGELRLAQPRELLAAAQRELELGRIGRAAMRLGGWVVSSPPGPPPVGDADLLVSEWENGRLVHLLPALGPAVARQLLRKLDSVHLDVRAARRRWQNLFEVNRGDDIVLLHEVALRLAATDEPEARTFHDLLRLARSFREKGLEQRTRTLLRLASSHMPARPQTRVELGKQMLATGLEEEGRRWLLDTARELLDAGDGERALIPIRAVLREMPENNEANGLLIQTQSVLAKRKRRRWNTAAALSAVLVLACAALVKYHGYRRVEGKLAEITSYMSQPEIALAMLEDAFGDDPSPRIAELRSRLVAVKKEGDEKRHAVWQKRFEDVQQQCEYGDALLALRGVLELPPPPDHSGEEDSWKERQDLLGILAQRFAARSEELDLDALATDNELAQEERLLDQLAASLAVLPPRTPSPEIATFRFHMEELRVRIQERRAARAVAREKMIAELKEKDQSILLATARAHHKAGDLDRSLQAYNLLIQSEQALAELPDLAREIEAVRSQWTAVQRAEELCAQGEHEAAYAELAAAGDRPMDFPMPWRVASRPAGARVTLSDGSVRVTPFEMRSGFGEEVTLAFELRGCVSRTLTITRPRDLRVSMHVHPERTWQSDHAVTAVPVAVGDDHIVGDRAGRMLRLDEKSEARWEIQLGTLGGVARTPIFLPGKPGFLLVLTEEGRTWLINATTGEAQGPRDIGSPPREGPTLTRGGVSARFADGRVALWTDRLEPSFYDANGLVAAGQPVESGGLDRSSTMIVLQASLESGSSLTSPWTKWAVEAHGEEYRVLAPDGRGFTAERTGTWQYLAWESPKALIPLGRLWVSDEAGVRSYLPAEENLVGLAGE
ncbi:MAG: DUF4388 domain-containing protein [Planctomycetota bacterium]